MHGLERSDVAAEPDDALAEDSALIVESFHEELNAAGGGTVPVLHAAAHDPATALRVGLPVDGEVPLPSGQDGMKLAGGRRWRRSRRRSEEHTSELQSRSDLVCRLLLEKKKK